MGAGFVQGCVEDANQPGTGVHGPPSDGDHATPMRREAETMVGA